MLQWHLWTSVWFHQTKMSCVKVNGISFCQTSLDRQIESNYLVNFKDVERVRNVVGLTEGGDWEEEVPTRMHGRREDWTSGPALFSVITGEKKLLWHRRANVLQSLPSVAPRMCLSCLLHKPFMKREGENVAKRKWRGGNCQKKPDKSNVEQNWARGKRDFENKDKGKVRQGEIKEEPKGAKSMKN